MKNKPSNKEILAKAGDFFRRSIASSHISNLEKLTKLKSFKYNPFLLEYLAIFVGGKATAENMAKALIYPRILGTSISTSFGSNVQKFCSEILPGFGSAIGGIDLEFIDKLDGRRKYCQVKAGPNTINKDDIETIVNKFKTIRSKAKFDNLILDHKDFVVGILYGTEEELNYHYRKIGEDYPVFIGKEFWHRLTGEESFFLDLIRVFGEIAKETNVKKILDNVIRELATEVEEQILSAKA